MGCMFEGGRSEIDIEVPGGALEVVRGEWKPIMEIRVIVGLSLHHAESYHEISGRQ